MAGRIRQLARTDRLVPQRARGHRSLRGDQTPAVRAHRWFRRAVHPVRQRCRARPRHDPVPRPPQRVHAPRPRPPPRVRDAQHPRSPTRLLRQLVALPALAPAGDPYYSPNLSLGSRKPKLRGAFEPTPAQRIAGPIGRDLQVFRQRSDASEAAMLADTCRIGDVDVAAVKALPTGATRPARTSAPSTGSCPTSTARTTAASTPRCGWPTSWRASTASRTASSRSRRPTSRSSVPRSRLPSRRWPTRRWCSPTAASPTRSTGPRRRRRHRDALAHRLLGGPPAAGAPPLLPRAGLRADVLPGGHQLRAGRGVLPARAVRALQHGSPARPVREAVRRGGLRVLSGGRPDRVPRRQQAVPQ